MLCAINLHICTATSAQTTTASKPPSAASSRDLTSCDLALREPLKDCIAIDGEAITLQCRLTSRATADDVTVTWYQGTREITSSDEFKQTIDGDRLSMTIAQIFPDDEGEYSCRIRRRRRHDVTQQSEVTSQCYLLVKGEISDFGEAEDVVEVKPMSIVFFFIIDGVNFYLCLHFLYVA